MNPPPIITADVIAVREARLTALHYGYSPLAVHGPDSLWVSNPRDRGKRPVGKQWQLGHDNEQLFAKITSWTTNMGLLCGDRGGGLIGLDLDITDTDVLAAVIRVAATLLPAWLTHRYRCNSPKILIPFRTAEPERGKIASGAFLTQRDGTTFENQIEVLGRGNQFVAAGRHTTGVELQWSGPPVWTAPLTSLPVITHAEIDTFLAAATPLLGEPKAPARKMTTKRPAGRLHALGRPAPAHILAGRRLNLNMAGRLESGFEKLDIVDKNKIIQECLWVLEPMADTSREAWLPLVIACWDAERLGATEARALCLEWCRTSKRFVSKEEFDKDWASFTHRGDGVTVATILYHAREAGALLAALSSLRPSDTPLRQTEDVTS